MAHLPLCGSGLFRLSAPASKLARYQTKKPSDFVGRPLCPGLDLQLLDCHLKIFTWVIRFLKFLVESGRVLVGVLVMAGIGDNSLKLAYRHLELTIFLPFICNS
jgi:hypothetical protein